MHASRRWRLPAVVLLVAALAGCAQTPVLQQLRDQKVTRVQLVVEGGPFVYGTPSSMDAAAAGPPVIALIGAIAAVAVQQKFNSVHEEINTAARTRGLPTADHRQAFGEQLARGLTSRGIETRLVSIPFETSMWGTGSDRTYLVPAKAELAKLPTDVPTLFLRTDFGTCTFGVIIPCIRYQLQNASTSTGTLRVFVQGATPRLAPKEEPKVKFQDLEEAKARLPEFDAALRDLVPEAVANLLERLEKGFVPAPR